MTTEQSDRTDMIPDSPGRTHSGSVKPLAAALVEALNWPTPDEEEWRRTDLSRLLPKKHLDACLDAPRHDGADALLEPSSSQPPAGFSARILTGAGRPLAVDLSPQALAAGMTVSWEQTESFSPHLEEAGRKELNASADRVASWHWRDMPGSLVIRLPRHARLEEVVLIEEGFTTPPDGLFTAPHLHVELELGASLALLWSFNGSAPARAVVNAGITGVIAADARLDFTLRQNFNDEVFFFIHGDLRVKRSGFLKTRESHLGGAMVKTRLGVALEGEGAEARLGGMFMAGAGTHVDVSTAQKHQAPRTQSNALYKGAVLPGGRSVYQGLIDVNAEAVKTDAFLSNANLILGENTRADSLPQLNILTDDVKCSHGSATGKLDPNQIFYLQSRCLTLEEARRELTRSFLAAAVFDAPEAVTEILGDDLDRALNSQ